LLWLLISIMKCILKRKSLLGDLMPDDINVTINLKYVETWVKKQIEIAKMTPALSTPTDAYINGINDLLEFIKTHATEA